MNAMWMTIAAFMVFLMQVGFLLIEAGLVRSKNSTNVAQKNVSDLVIGVMSYSLLGFALMFGVSQSGLFGMGGAGAVLEGSGRFEVELIFNLAFCSVVATIVSGAVAERMKIGAYLISTAVIAALIYPVFGHWSWGNSIIESNPSLLGDFGFVDHAGGIVIHALGGVYAFVAAIILGARQGRFDSYGNVIPITGHSNVLALTGGLILFVCWVPFNTGAMEPGSAAFTLVAVATVVAGCAGGLFGMLTGYFLDDKTFDPMASVNGILGGLVAVTAGVGYLDIYGAAAIGALGGLAAIGGQHLLLHKLKVDDPVGAASVHGIAGLLGGVLFPLVATKALPAGSMLAQIGVQALGAGAAIIWAGGAAFIVLGIMKKLDILRVSEAQEHLGLNFGEHLPGVTAEHLASAFEVSKPAAELPLQPASESRKGRRRVALTQIDSVPTSEVGYALAKMTDAHKEKAEELAATLSTFETALESMADGMLIFDAEGEAVQVNASFKKTMAAFGVRCGVGTTRRELGEGLRASGGLRLSDISQDEWLARFLSPEGRNVAEEQSVSGAGDRHFIMRLVPTADGGQVLSFTDVSEIERGRLAAEEAQRTKAEFLANMSHEIRTPMNGIIGMADLLRKSNLEPRQQNFVDTIQKCGTALVKIINDILDFSKLEAGQTQIDSEPFLLRECVDDVTTLLSNNAAQKNIDLLVRYRPTLPSTFVGDAGRMRQILTNLIGNAVKFTETGHVLVEVDGDVQGKMAHLTLRVQDTGIGIPADQVNKVFEKFKQVDGSNTRKYEGTGLGLSITSNLIGMMGGDVRVESTLGEGSTFIVTLTLPVAEDIKRPKPAPVEIIGSRVLVIDDNAVNREILAEQLAHWKCESAAVPSAQKGLSVLRKASSRGLTVDLVIVDFQMPGMDGEAFYHAMQQDSSIGNIPVIMLTSVSDDAMAHRLREAGLNAMLTKPAPQSLLLDTIATSLNAERSDFASLSDDDADEEDYLTAFAAKEAPEPAAPKTVAAATAALAATARAAAAATPAPAPAAAPVEEPALPTATEEVARFEEEADEPDLAEEPMARFTINPKAEPEPEPEMDAGTDAEDDLVLPDSSALADAMFMIGEDDAGEGAGNAPLDLLVAEDNETNRNYIEYILDDFDLNYQIVTNGRLAVEAWQEFSPRMILMDVSMPEMNGYQATQKIRELEAASSGGATPIIALTAHTLKGDRERCLESGMDDYMSKPVSVDDVRDMLVKWELLGKAREAV